MDRPLMLMMRDDEDDADQNGPVLLGTEMKGKGRWGSRRALLRSESSGVESWACVEEARKVRGAVGRFLSTRGRGGRGRGEAVDGPWTAYRMTVVCRWWSWRWCLLHPSDVVGGGRVPCAACAVRVCRAAVRDGRAGGLHLDGLLLPTRALGQG